MSYRPTVRYCDEFKDYINEMFRATILDRNQIIRLALYVAAHSEEYKVILKQYKRRGDVPIPLPKWTLKDHQIWLESEPESIGEGSYVNVDDSRTREIEEVVAASEQPGLGGKQKENRCIEPATRRAREVPSEKRVFRNAGGIRITLS